MSSPQPAASDTPISPGLARGALAVERYVLPWVYMFFAYQRFWKVLEHYREYELLKRYAAVRGVNPVALSITYASLTKDFLLFLLMVFTAVTLQFSRAPVTLPDKLKHILVPLVMSYYFLLYGAVDRLPAPFRHSLLPPILQRPAAVSGLMLSLVGYAVAIWALLYLGRSFAILVSIRKVVSRGPYAYVRHPIYLGYAIELCGLLLANCSIAMLILGAGFVAFLVSRARIEEEKLCEANEGYREYLKRTGFLLPRLRDRRS